MNGIVIKSTGSWYSVRLETGETVRCRIKGKFRVEGFKTTNPVAVGDNVELEQKRDDEWMITRIGERKNYIVRKSTNLSREKQVIAANVDQALLVVTVKFPETSTVFMDRFLASAEAYGVPAIIVFNKIDLLDEEDLLLTNALSAIYQEVGYKCIKASAMTGEGMEMVTGALAGKVSVLAGLSGTGKSTLINRVEPGLSLRTAAISDAHETGRHTTTFAEMFPLSIGGFIVDTPGVRAFGLVDVKREELSLYFPEIFRVSRECHYYNCTHVHEPGCAVMEAVENGKISESRYTSYVSMFNENEDKYRKNIFT
ncbi:MAG: ribosome small subunit-dependent GTPase A [Odoribacteraceae bacterium]|nr:ribosome small subunit-dependent GTPase A [Odoribacteraceae bacterium]